MPCTHKFFGHNLHQNGAFGLIPNWDFKTLIIGTFNPENIWADENMAGYFYGRRRNYFWSAIGQFGILQDIERNNTIHQFQFLQEKKIGLTDLLIRIEDADITNLNHVAKIKTYGDKEIESFHDFFWNTEQIINTILNKKVEAVYFTWLGKSNRIRNPFNSFENQMRIVEDFCDNNGILNCRLYTPSGQGLRSGTPRINKLINQWYNHNGGQEFPFRSPNFDINNYPFQ
ncbi:hypothetical protein [Emticicia sp. C21]|uniref:hypothetical protein n=1 Tax=Emticicia sp. C21 TaxID=2302915 RepID=UPI000E357CE5|nr:hypothetical protein [Emticicia sp. C21]RFS16659.1 hypothetical protein D0T08_08215 [Emticicia sp. C21]